MLNSGFKIHNPGDIIGSRYQIVQKLASGGFGCTYLATDLGEVNRSKCVVKQLQPIFNSPFIWEDAKKRFHTEANSLKTLGFHPQIPHLFDYFEENQEFYLVQEFIDGEDLSKEINKELFNETKLIAFLFDVLEVLAFVHQHGTIHRDIKPANLIRRKTDGKIVLIDFGAVKQEITTFLADEQTRQKYTEAIGTQGYWPPEQRLGLPRYNSDIYAVGRTAICALTGEQPIYLEDTVTGELKNWQSNLEISQKLVDIINKMTRPSHQERYQKASEVLHDLVPLIKIGQTVERRYQVISYLGGGMLSHTYLAIDQLDKDRSPCVLKQLKLHSSDPELRKEAVRRFHNELKVLQQLGDHEQIPQLYRHFEENQELYLVQQFIEGDDLSKEIKERQKLSQREVIELLRDVLQALEFIHKQNIIHRDIKPSNLIRRRKDKKIVVIDFGIVKSSITISTGMSGSRTLTQPIGTEGYIPPEQMGKRPTYSSDIYALGITAIQALTGLPPDQFPTDQKTGKLLWEEFPQISDKLAKILNKMVCLELKKRYKTAKQVQVDLAKIDRESQTRRLIVALGTGFLLAIFSVPFIYYNTKENLPRKLFFQGNEFFNKAEYEEAIKKYNQVLEIDPRYHEALTNKGIAEGKLGEYYDMRASCELATTINRNSYIAWNCLGEALINTGEYEKANKAFEQAIAINPQEAAFLINKSEALLRLKEFPDAYQTINQAITLLTQITTSTPEEKQELDKELATAYSYKAWSLRELQQFKNSLEAYNLALQYNPNYIFAQIGQAITFWKNNQPQEAIAQFEKIIDNTNSTEEEKAEALYYKGLILCENNDRIAGNKFVQQALTINPKLPNIEKNICPS